MNILLVDDEDVTLRAIKAGVDWSSIGIENIYTATNIKWAKKIMEEQIMEKQTIDVLLCDIDMPYGNGIDMLAWVKENYPDVVFLFLTCHAEFQYARQAIALGAFDYLLKPVPYTELEQILAGAIDKRKQLLRMSTIKKQFGMDERTESSRDSVQKVKTYVKEHLHEDITRERIAEYVYLNPSYLSRLFRKETNMSMVDYINHQRIETSKFFLEQSDLSVLSISVKVGFSYVSYFDKVFKKSVGMTPAEYRERYKKSQK